MFPIKHPLRAALLFAAAASATLHLSPVYANAPVARGAAEAVETSYEARESAPKGKKDIKKLQAAAKVLAKEGFDAESQRLQEIIEGMKEPASRQPSEKQRARAAKQAKAKLKRTAKGIEARAKGLLKQDVKELAVRVDMLELIADGYAAAGYETSEDALRFFVGVGRTQDGQGDPPSMPESLREGDGTVMDRLVRIVRSGDKAMGTLGCKNGAAVARRLGEFYGEREASRALPAQGEETPGRRLDAIGYGGGDVEEEPEESEESELRARIEQQRRLVAELTEELKRLRAQLKQTGRR